MIYAFFSGGLIALLLLFILIYFVDYFKAFYFYSFFVIIVLILALSCGTKIANYLYGIDGTKTFTIEEEYENDKMIYPFQKAIGGLVFLSTVALFIMSLMNLFVFKKIKEIPNSISVVFFIFTSFLIILFLIIMRFYSNRLI
ncbi:hypothetical protein AR687_13400 [Flavobacteriaceae bacterium CRH]|nr:hypothetical protein AR687_13400 [Flavobacteriaceae bacterium CRH]